MLIAGLAAFVLGRGLVAPLGAICGVMDDLAKGDLNVEVPLTAAGPGHGVLVGAGDLILSRADRFLLQGRSPLLGQPGLRVRLKGLPQFVVTRGGEYCFLPGLRALRWLAELTT